MYKQYNINIKMEFQIKKLLEDLILIIPYNRKTNPIKKPLFISNGYINSDPKEQGVFVKKESEILFIPSKDINMCFMQTKPIAIISM